MATAFSLNATAADLFYGGSRDLGIHFEARGGANWCRQEVEIELVAGKRDAFEHDTERLQQMVGRIRAAAEPQCPAMERILIDGKVSKKSLYAATASRLTSWRLVRRDINEGRPLCQPAGHQCDLSVEIFTRLERTFRLPVFADVEMTSYLNPDNKILAQWRNKNGIVGQVRALELAPGRHANDIAEQVLAVLSARCWPKSTINLPHDIDVGDRLSFRAFKCDNDRSSARTIIIEPSKYGWFLYTISAGTGSGDELSKFSDFMFSSFNEARE